MNHTLILRFRDLVTPVGDTVQQHKDIIRQSGYVWWGWWKRPYEQIPTNLLLDIHRELPIEIYLFDSGGINGQLHLYQATLDEIAQTPTGSTIQSPEPSLTPSYYNNNWLSVWFKLTTISERVQGDIAVTIDALPTWPSSTRSNIEKHIGQIVKGQAQLRDIDVTLWYGDIENR